jgi:outer membrane protein assembly factor BamE (lipoprotein component of BamABCDE complex)
MDWCWHYLPGRLYCIIHAFRTTRKFRFPDTMIIRSILCASLLLFAGTGCGLIYKQNIQQGNALEQDELDELYIGMNQRQVLFVLGTPSVMDPFQPDRWDYVQTFSRRGGDMVQRTVTLRFKDGLLSEIEGQSNPFAAAATQSGSSPSVSSGAVASFVKKPDASPQDASVESAEKEVLGKKEPKIDTVPDRSSDDRDYRKDQDVLDQTPKDGPVGPDIDG